MTEATNIEQYLSDNPAYRLCRTERHQWDVIDENWVQSYDDAMATHEKKAQCLRCGMVRRRRARVGISRGRMVSFAKLPTVYNAAEAKGYHVHGVGRGGLTGADVDEWELRHLLERNGSRRRRGSR